MIQEVRSQISLPGLTRWAKAKSFYSPQNCNVSTGRAGPRVQSRPVTYPQDLKKHWSFDLPTCRNGPLARVRKLNGTCPPILLPNCQNDGSVCVEDFFLRDTTSGTSSRLTLENGGQEANSQFSPSFPLPDYSLPNSFWKFQEKRRFLETFSRRSQVYSILISTHSWWVGVFCVPWGKYVIFARDCLVWRPFHTRSGF